MTKVFHSHLQLIFILFVCIEFSCPEVYDKIIQNIVQHTLVLSVILLMFLTWLPTDTHLYPCH
jgi:hypothetical protein